MEGKAISIPWWHDLTWHDLVYSWGHESQRRLLNVTARKLLILWPSKSRFSPAVFWASPLWIVWAPFLCVCLWGGDHMNQNNTWMKIAGMNGASPVGFHPPKKLLKCSGLEMYEVSCKLRMHGTVHTLSLTYQVGMLIKLIYSTGVVES